MSNQPLDKLTLREMFTEVDRMVLELSEHLGQGFLTKLNSLRRVVRTSKEDDASIGDATVREQVSDVLKSEYFANELVEKIHEYFSAIDHGVNQIVHGESDSLNDY